MEEKFTPMMAQYRRLKREFADFILMFRLGDFYEMFEDDAKRASEILGITLTRRTAGKGGAVPMCGVPYHSASRYLQRLLKAGCKVAISEQVEDPKKAKGLVKREIVEVLTPGAILREEFLKEGEKNYLAAVWPADDGVGLTLVEPSTGEFLATEFKGKDAREGLLEELARRNPREVVVSESTPPYASPSRGAELGATKDMLKGFMVHVFRDTAAVETGEDLARWFGVHSIAAFDLEDRPLATKAAALALSYLLSLKIVQLHHLTGVRFYMPDQRMLLDANTVKNLELLTTWRGEEGSLMWAIDRTKTPMGKRLLRAEVVSPLKVIPEIRGRQEAVEALFKNGYLRDDQKEALGGMGDLERLAGKFGAGRAKPYDLFRLRTAVTKVQKAKKLLSGTESALLVKLREETGDFGTLSARLDSILAPEWNAENVFRDGFDAERDELRQLATHSEQWFREFEESERRRTGIRTLKVRFNRIFGYFIEISKAGAASAPADYERKQTLVNADRFTTLQLKEMEEKVLTAQERLESRDNELLAALYREVQVQTGELVSAARAVALLDFLLCLAEIAEERDYVKPIVDDQGRIAIRKGRHPVVEALLPPGEFVPNDAYLDLDEMRLGVVTGPNMAGKSTYIRQAALVVLLAQMGGFVPAERAEIGVADAIFTRVGASDDIARGQSTFMVEMTETAKILRNATKRSLVVLDEIGRGTSTFDGISIAWAVAEHLAANLKCRTIFATHYHELTALEDHADGVFNLQVVIEERGKEIVFLHRVGPGRATRSYGIEVAKLAGLPGLVVRRAEEILNEMENRAPGPERASQSPEQRTQVPEIDEESRMF
ncbi:MAG: DNA mismatch repair protein MutS [bacterium]